jgi:N-acetylneuraminate synthase
MRGLKRYFFMNLNFSSKKDSKTIMEKFSIHNHVIGDGCPCFIVGEVAQAHDGSLGMAHAFIDAIARAGGDAVKFQTHFADAESTIDEPWRIKFSKQDVSRFDYWKRMEFTEGQWRGLKEHAESKGLVFLSSPFSRKAVDILNNLGMCAWKIPSGEVNNLRLLELVANTGSPILLSSGMSMLEELDAAVEFCRNKNAHVAVFQCTTAYPCPPEMIGLNLLRDFKLRYQCPVGLSDHSSKIYSGLAAVANGASLLEVHVTFSKDMFGPDVSSSLDFREFSQLIEGVRYIEKLNLNPVSKDNIAKKLETERKLFSKSIVLSEDLPRGTVLLDRHLDFKKPGTGIPAREVSDVIGKRLKYNLKKDTLISFYDLA